MLWKGSGPLGDTVTMLPDRLPRLVHESLTLRGFEDRDAPLVQSVADDRLIPQITTVPTSGTVEDALAFIAGQHDRLATGAGYSFAIADSATDEAVGQIGLWLRNIDHGRASTGYWVAPQFRRRGYQREGLLRSWEQVGGQWWDMYVYSRVDGRD